ncbi:MAG: flippase-like domain-containing protein [Deltaproteobacteria bacterium]|nr:flippase-like domain-containing protein [Deltaproteobacteria bacterium]
MTGSGEGTKRQTEGGREGRPWTRFVPWVIGLVCLAYVFYVVPLADVWRILVVRRLWGLIPLVFGGVVVLFILDGFALKVNMSAFGVPVSFRDALRIRGQSYALAAVNYNAGQGGLVVLFRRETGRDVVELTGAVLSVMGVQFVVLAGALVVGLVLSDTGALLVLRPYAWTVVLGFLVYLVAVWWSPGFLRRWRLTKPVMEARVMGNLAAIASRLPHTAALFAIHWAAISMVGIHPPAGDAIVRLSAIFFVVALPISIQGLGTGQATAVALLAPYATGGGPAVVAYSLSVWALGLLSQVLIGAGFLARATVTRSGNGSPPVESGS